MQAVIDRLLASEEPSIRFEVRPGVLGEDPASPELHRLRSEIRRSPRARAMAGRPLPSAGAPAAPLAVA
jgi:hypothetical protein